MSFGIPVRNGLGVGLLASTFLSTRRGTGGGGGPTAALDLNFITGSYQTGGGSYAFQDLIRFSRTTAGTFVGSNGLIQNSPISNNLLLWTEEAENAAWTKTAVAVQSNLLLRSQEYDNASWTKNTAFISTNLLRYSEEFDNSAAWGDSITGTGVTPVTTANQGAAPDGTTTADRIQFSLGGGTATTDISRRRQVYTTPATQHTFSIYLKSFDGVSTYDMHIVGPQGLTTPVVVTPTWQRFTVTAIGAGSVSYAVGLRGGQTPANSNTADVLAWGAQLVQGSVPGDYQRTEAAALAVAYTAPDGTLTADKLVADNTAALNASFVRQNISKTANTTTYTSSVYAKAGEFNRVRIVARDNASSANLVGVTISLVDGSVFSAPSPTGTFTNASVAVTDVGGGWYRIALTFTTGTETAIWGQAIYAQDSVATTGDGASGIYVWGSQLVNGPVAETYQPTSASVVAIQHLAPNGVLSANKIVENSANTYHFVRNPVTAANVAHTFTTYLKAGERTRVIVAMTDIATGDAFIGVDLTNGTTFTASGLVTGSWTSISSSVTSVGSGWYRVRVTGTKGAGTQIAGCVFPTNGTSATFLGDGSSGFYMWGSQLEVGSSATAYSRNADGLYAPRFDYDPVTLEAKGLLIEEQRTNLIPRSEEFDNATTWAPGAVTTVTVTANAATSPDGTVDADKLILANGISSATATAYLYTNISKSAVSTTYTFSCYAKEAEYDVFRILINDNAASANFALGAWSLADGSVSEAPSVNGTFTNPSGTATAVGNGWYRVTLTFTTSTEITLRVRIYPRDSSGAVTGDGVSGIYIYGAQLEAGAFVTSYIPTAASTVTRAADIALVTGGAFTSWYNPLEGTLSADVIPQLSNVANQFIGSLSDGTNINRASIFKATSGLGGFRTTASGTAANPNGPASVPLTGNVAHKVGLAFTTGPSNVVCAVDGTLGSPATLSSMPTNMNILRFGVNEAGNADWLNGYMRGVRYYNTRLTDAELQTVTT